MNQKLETILNKWLEIEYFNIAKKAKFIIKESSADDALILDTIRCLDYITTMEKDVSKSYVITIIALMWEYINRDKYDIKNFILKILSRIGYSTSAIIIDESFLKSNRKFFRPNSFFDMISITLEQQKYEIEINNYDFLLTEFQKSIWEAMNHNRIIGISAPTSAGKSFVILLKSIARIIEDKIDIVYIVPTLSLLNQVTEDYNKYIKMLGIEKCKIANSFVPNDKSDKCTIYVLTQEKALSAISSEISAFSKRLILIVDEIQNIERVQENNDLRSKILFDTLIEFKQKKNVDQIIISGPRIDGIGQLGNKIFGERTFEISTVVCPVLNITYGIRKENDKYFFKQYCSLKGEAFTRRIQNDKQIVGYGKKLYSDEYMDYLMTFIQDIGKDDQNIIFAPTSDTAKDIACAIASKMTCDGELQDLINYYADTINENYAMCKTLINGVAYHHGKLPMHVRRTLEKVISDKKVQYIVCTTTLMQGVNMPAQNVIVRNPHLYIRKKSNTGELSSYEMANLRGRAGRLLKDFIGRTYVLDESGFDDLDEYDQVDLFEDTSLELPSGYGEKYEEYKREISEALKSELGVDSSMKEYGYLVSYIRQTILRYGTSAREKMHDVGINLTKDQVAAIIAKMNDLNVPKEVCYKNRYWDPLVLDYIYSELKIRKLPNTPMERGAKARLDDILKFLRDNDTTSAMYNKYIPEENREKIGRSFLCKACMMWSCETPLSIILSGDRYQGDDATKNIDDMIETLQNTVAFNVPLLLKPIFDMFNKDSIFLLCMQAGAYKPVTRRMIEIGIPRETAIFLNKELFINEKVDQLREEKLEDFIQLKIRKAYSSLPYWIRIQLEFMV